MYFCLGRGAKLIFFFVFGEAVSAARTKVLASDTNEAINKIGGLKWTRTIDLPLIRRTL